MPEQPYSLEPVPGHNAYKVTSMLKDYLAMQMETPDGKQIIDSVIQLIDNYVIQLKNLRQQSIIKTTAEVNNAIDGFFAKTSETDKQEIQCTTGCTACCYINVDVSPDEAALIIDYCRQNDIAIDKAYLNEQAVAGRMTYSQVSRCVFLQDNLCSIYPVRPIACRKHWVKTNPALCDFSGNIVNQVGGFFNINTEILASAMMNVQEVMPFEKALLQQIEQPAV